MAPRSRAGRGPTSCGEGDSVNEGDSLDELRVTPDKYVPHRYAGASGDFNPIHIDKEFAQMVGLPSNILHGLYGMAQVARAAQDAAGGDPRRVRRLGGPVRGVGFPGEGVVGGGGGGSGSGGGAG